MSTKNEKELIVLLHGFGSTRLVMWPFACLLRARNFRVLHWGYPSLFDPIEKHAIRFSDYLHSTMTAERRFHIVAHSMGSIIARSALNLGDNPNVGRLVLLAPPNSGSPVARVASKWVGHIIPPTRELSDARDSYVNQLANATAIEVGTVAARFDMLVPVSNTHLANEAAHVILNATHNSLLISKKTSILTSRFLRHGNFHEID